MTNNSTTTCTYDDGEKQSTLPKLMNDGFTSLDNYFYPIIIIVRNTQQFSMQSDVKCMGKDFFLNPPTSMALCDSPRAFLNITSIRNGLFKLRSFHRELEAESEPKRLIKNRQKIQVYFVQKFTKIYFAQSLEQKFVLNSNSKGIKFSQNSFKIN